MNDKLADVVKREPVSIAIESLKKTKHEIEEQYLRDIAELDRAIANLKKLPSKKGVESVRSNGHGSRRAVVISEGPIDAAVMGSWEGMGITDAVHAFLSTHHKPIPFSILMSGLQQRGVRLGDPAKPRRYQANLKTAVINNAKRFRYDKKRDTVVLLRAQAAAV